MSKESAEATHRFLLPAALVAIGFGLGSWWFRDPGPPRGQTVRSPEPAMDTPQESVKGPVGDPAIRYRNIPDLIRRFEAQIAELERENKRLDQVMIGDERPPDDRLTTSDVENQGQRIFLLNLKKNGNRKLISDLEQRIQSLRREPKELQRNHNSE